MLLFVSLTESAHWSNTGLVRLIGNHPSTEFFTMVVFYDLYASDLHFVFFFVFVTFLSGRGSSL